MGYIRDHWQGRQSLAWSFWVNFVVVGATLLALERQLQLPTDPEPLLADALPGLLFVAGQWLVLVWQAVGVLRACDRHIAQYGSIMSVWGAQAGAIAGVLLTGIASYWMLLPVVMERPPPAPPLQPDAYRPPAYTLTLTDDGKSIHITGDFDPGLADAFEALLGNLPDVTRVVMDSDGGHVNEARRMASIIRTRGLETASMDRCKSACTTPFIAGARRTLGRNAKLGFHRYHVALAMRTPFYNLEAEHEKERAFYRDQGVGEDFVERVFQRPPNEIWFPTHEELLSAGVVHRIAEAVQPGGG